MISELVFDADLTPITQTHTMQKWQLRMGRMMQEQYTHKRGSYEWNLAQANIDAINVAINLVDANSHVNVRLLV